MKKLNNFEKWVTSQKLWVTILLIIFTYFIWLFIYLYCKYKEKSIESKQEKTSQKFECMLENVNKYDCHSLIGTLLHFELLDKNDLYDGYSDDEIEDYELKVYECNNHALSCEIKWDEKSDVYKVVYSMHSNNYCFGKIPKKYNIEVNEIINNKIITFGGMIIDKGYYKEFDNKKNKIIKGYDDCQIKLVINYMDKKETKK